MAIASDENSNGGANLEDGYELCPVCAMAVSPGAVDVCEHYLGLWLEGSLIWSDFDADGPWRRVTDSIEVLSEAGFGVLQRICVDPISKKVLEAVKYLESGWWTTEFGIQSVSHEPVGIFGDAGTTLYHECPGETFQSISEALIKVAEEAERIAGEENH